MALGDKLGVRHLRYLTMGAAVVVGLGMGAVITRPWKSVLEQMTGEGGECDFAPVGQLAAPGGEERAVWYTRDCPASTGTTLDVAIVGARAEVPAEPGNALVLDANGHRPALAASWLPKGELQLAIEPKAEVIARVEKVGRHAVVLVPLLPDGGR